MNLNKRYWVFANRCYYASGGLNDLLFTSSSAPKQDGIIAALNDDGEFFIEVYDSKRNVFVSVFKVDNHAADCHYDVSDLKELNEDWIKK